MGAKDVCPNLPKIARKSFGPHFIRFSCDLGAIFSNQTMLGAIFIKSEHVGRHFCSKFLWTLPRFSEIFLRVSQILPRFQLILPGFSGIWPRCSPNQNMCGCTFTPALRLLHRSFFVLTFAKKVRTNLLHTSAHLSLKCEL